MSLAIAALALRLLVPVGYMPATGQQGAVITICTGMGTQSLGQPVPDDRHDRNEPGKGAGETCAFAGLGLLSTGAIDPPLLIAAMHFVTRSGLLPIYLPDGGLPAFLRPPLRGPPRTA